MDNIDPRVLLNSMLRFFTSLPREYRQPFLEQVTDIQKRVSSSGHLRRESATVSRGAFALKVFDHNKKTRNAVRGLESMPGPS